MNTSITDKMKFTRIYSHAMRWRQIASLYAQNLLSRRPLTGDADVVVSLTTYGARTAYVHLAIESLAVGSVLPKKVILWLDETDVLENLPKPLWRLERRGLEIRRCHNYGPHKKYYPYVESLDAGDIVDPLVIIDDDFLYPASWLSSLLDSYRMYPDVVSCTRAHEFQMGDTPKPYSEWPSCQSDAPSRRTFATGVGGVLYPPAVQLAIKSHGTNFSHCAPKADDVWLHYVTIASGSAVRQVSPEALNLEFKILPFAQGSSLQNENVGLSGNDKQIAMTYDERTLSALHAS